MDLAEELERKRLGVEVKNHWMGTCLFADDIVLIARNSRKLQEMLGTVANFAEAWKMKFTAKKCGVLVVGEKLQKTRQYTMETQEREDWRS